MTDPARELSAQAGPDFRVLTAVGFGGFLGTIARYGAGERWTYVPGTFPTTTFVVNTAGALIMGAILTVILVQFPDARLARPFLCTGVLGGWTTMSAVAVEIVLLGEAGHFGTAAVYAVATIFTGVVAGALGIAGARRIFVHRSAQ